MHGWIGGIYMGNGHRAEGGTVEHLLGYEIEGLKALLGS